MKPATTTTARMPTSLAPDRRNFWPRPGPTAFVPDLGDDRPCAQCGYNLRGLPFGSVCPECGAACGVAADVEPVPWNDDQTAGSYFRTLLMVLTRPRELAGHAWSRDMLWMRPARRFRRTCVALATLGVVPVVVALQAGAIGAQAALLCAPIDLMAVLWGFIAFTAEPPRFFADKGTDVSSRRAELLASYFSAALALSPLHLVLLALATLDPMTARSPGEAAMYIALALHGALVLVQVLLMAAAEAAMLGQLVELPRGGGAGIALGNAGLRLLRLAFYVGAVPLLVAMMAAGENGR